MAGQNVPVILLPRFTTLVGLYGFYTEPMHVARYSAISVNLWHGPIRGTGPKMEVVFGQSNDAVNWTSTTQGVPTPQSESQHAIDLTQAWLRVGFVFSAGTNPATTAWAEGFFELRER